MINTWNESLLHEELKEYYCAESGRTEVPVEGSICDIVLQDRSIVEIQTQNISALSSKLDKLLVHHRVRLVYPVPVNLYIETYNADRTLKSRRKSPKHGTVYQIFPELTKVWHHLENENLTITLVYSDILQVRIADGTGSWRRKGIRLDDRKLIRIHGEQNLCGSNDYLKLLPDSLPEIFTTADLKQLGVGSHAGYMAWVLNKCELVELVGKKGRFNAYRIKSPGTFEALATNNACRAYSIGHPKKSLEVSTNQPRAGIRARSIVPFPSSDSNETEP
ncbi:MAG TPA: hypothetical protein PK408_05770 [Treponemataceae bacterium]|jgi:hypothetical protein|nr:hypothetical protein [Treponemataceae bacterium]